MTVPSRATFEMEFAPVLVTHRLPSESSAMPVAVAAVANVAMSPGAAVTAGAIATSDPPTITALVAIATARRAVVLTVVVMRHS